MPKKKAIKINLSEEENALVFYEKTCGRNESIKRHSTILYYANQGTESVNELCRRSGHGKEAVNRILNLYNELGIEAIYVCSRGKRINHLDQIGDELETFFDENPPADIPSAMKTIKEEFNITLTKTPVRIWLKKRIFVQKVKKYSGESRPDRAEKFSE